MTTYAYAATFEPTDGFIVTFEDVPEAIDALGVALLAMVVVGLLSDSCSLQ
ncbi:hypothetical protein [Rhizobium leguminosarum]|uniref:hypothetical protein n=1 Tax=Rhizobium TaxID=379 RepID=UPI0021B11D06|nr:hypothetical protein [Rhizobium leguminosarum]